MSINVRRIVLGLGLLLLTAVANSAWSQTSGYTIGGTVTGLSNPVLVIENSINSNTLTVTANGSFAFSTTVAAGGEYAVYVLSQPPGANCTVTNGQGAVGQANVTTVAIACVPAFTALSATMTAQRCYPTATLLPNGQVLLTGGQTNSGVVLNTAELFDPLINTFTALSATMTVARAGHTATLLPDGTVLLSGGYTAHSGTALSSAEIYDPVSNTFTALKARMQRTRVFHAAVLLPSGQVLLTGGSQYVSGAALDSAELYDPVGQTFTLMTATMTKARWGLAAALLPNGQVLLTGGTTPNGYITPLAEVYDPVAQTFTALSATMRTDRRHHAATLLPSGELLLTGGQSNEEDFLNSAEVYNYVTQTFRALPATMTLDRQGHSATLLPSGLVLVAGGEDQFNNDVNTAEVYDALAPISKRFASLSATMTTPRVFHTATLLPNGQVLVTGGVNWNADTTLNTGEVYDPVTQTFTLLNATMAEYRAGHTATLMRNGLVLLAGGCGGACGAASSAEVYDPVPQTFTALSAAMVANRFGHTATLLPNGEVLLTGGFVADYPVDTAEVYDPIAQTFTALNAKMTVPRGGHTATLLPSGQVLIAGGQTGQNEGVYSNKPLDTAEVYDPAAQTFTALGATMTTRRVYYTATLLPSGEIVLAGGADITNYFLNTAELYDPVAQIFTALKSKMKNTLQGHAATLLPDGNVLIAGGDTAFDVATVTPETTNTTELYFP
jgi:N-acetylneuraminic acid mutarotase